MSSAPDLVAASAYGSTAPSTRVRLLDWLAHLGLSALRMEYAGLANNSTRTILRAPLAVAAAEWRTRGRSAAERVDGRSLVLSREASPFSRGAVEERLLTRAAWGVYDLDDALFADTAGWRRVLGKDEKCRRAMSAADMVVVGNDYLASYAADHATRVTVIPSCVEPDDYTPKTDYSVEDRPEIVWLGSGSTEQYVVEIAPALREVQRRTGARLTLISSARTEERPELDGLVTRVPWRASEVAARLAAADVAIAPLRDDEYARGKCAYKVLQYAAAGLPIVASPVGANALAIERFDAWSAVDHADWVSQVEDALSMSAARREARGQHARSAVAEHYSFAAWADEWRKAVGL